MCFLLRVLPVDLRGAAGIYTRGKADGYGGWPLPNLIPPGFPAHPNLRVFFNELFSAGPPQATYILKT